MSNNKFRMKDAILPSTIVFIIWSILAFLIYYKVEKVELIGDQLILFSLFATVLGILAGGCISGFISHCKEYGEAQKGEKETVVFISYSLIIGIFIFISLSLLCLAKVGVLQLLDNCILILLFIGIYAILNSLILIERWSYTILVKSKKNKNQTIDTPSV